MRSEPSHCEGSSLSYTGDYQPIAVTLHQLRFQQKSTMKAFFNSGFWFFFFLFNVVVGTASQRTAVSLRRAPAAKRLRLQHTERKGRAEAFSHAHGKQGAKTGPSAAATGCNAPPSSQESQLVKTQLQRQKPDRGIFRYITALVKASHFAAA